MKKRTLVKIRKFFNNLWICSPIYAIYSSWIGTEEISSEYPKYGITKNKL